MKTHQSKCAAQAFLRLDWNAVRQSLLLARLQAEFHLVEIPSEE